MGKLPKSLQKKRKKARNLRTKGTKTHRKTNVNPKSMNRQMRRKLQSQGLDGMEEIQANRVIIQTGDDEDLIIESPQVIKVEQQGMEVYQVIGSAKKVPSGSGSHSGEKNITELQEPTDDEILEVEEMNVKITEQDIQLVAMQTGKTPEVAENALKESNGDLAKAIMNLKTL